MAYLLLIHEPVGQRQTRTRAEGEAAYGRMLRFADELKGRGVLRAVESLASQDGATARVEVRNGRAQVMDGPFAEAKEMVGGFFLLDCETREEAVAIAKQCPAAEWATFATEHGIELAVCVAAALRRGVLGSEDAARYERAATNVSPPFQIVGLGQMVEAAITADRFVTFCA